MKRAALWLLLIGACRTGRPDAPAVLVAPTAEARAALARTVRDALGGREVLLADDALVADSSLIIERTPRKDPAGLPAMGRETEKPERFTLLKKAKGGCVLVHARTGKRYDLDAACEAYSPPVNR